MRKLHLKYRIFYSFIFVSLITLVVGGVSYYFLKNVSEKYEHVAHINMGNLDKLSDMKDAARTIRARMNFIMGFPKGHEDEVKIAFDRIEKEFVRYETNDKAYQSIEFVPGEEEIYKKAATLWGSLKQKNLELLEHYKKESASEKTLGLFFNGYAKTADDFFEAIDALMKFQDEQSEKWVKDSEEISALANKVSFILVILSFGASFVIGYFIAITLTNELSAAILELNHSAPELRNASSSMSDLSTELSSCSTEQAASVQETASSLEEIAAMIKRNSDNANNAKISSNTSLDSVKKGQDAVENMLEAMKEINQNNDSFNEFMARNNQELNQMVQVITNISDKTKIINDIVFQTKLLSFNASVEAARAGEQGKGFAVVAEEVGNLAQMSGNAANEIKELLQESIVKVNAIVSTTKVEVEKLVTEGKDKIKLGVERAQDCNVALEEINATVSSVESLVSEVAHASGEQSQGISEVNKAMMQIDEVTNQNSVASQNVSTSAALVLQLSGSLNETASKLTRLLNGDGHSGVQSLSALQTSEHKRPVLAVKKAKTTASASMERPKREVKKDQPKVVQLPKVAAKKEAPVKMAVNAAPIRSQQHSGSKKARFEGDIPSADDSRFEDV